MITIYRAIEKSTGREWHYRQRRTYGKIEFRFAYGSVTSWAPTLDGARKAAKEMGCFRYVDDPPLVIITN